MNKNIISICICLLAFTYTLIKPDKLHPGMKHFYIEPKPVSDLQYCKASYNSQYGKIVSDWNIDKDGNFNLRILVPANTTATVILPEWGNGSILESGTPVSEMKNITVSKENPNKMEVLSGAYSFKVSK